MLIGLQSLNKRYDYSKQCVFICYTAQYRKALVYYVHALINQCLLPVIQLILLLSLIIQNHRFLIHLHKCLYCDIFLVVNTNLQSPSHLNHLLVQYQLHGAQMYQNNNCCNSDHDNIL